MKKINQTISQILKEEFEAETLPSRMIEHCEAVIARADAHISAIEWEEQYWKEVEDVGVFETD